MIKETFKINYLLISKKLHIKTAIQKIAVYFFVKTPLTIITIH